MANERWMTYDELKQRVNDTIREECQGSFERGMRLLQSVEDDLFKRGKTIVPCSVCAKKIGLKRCGACPQSTERYCSRECQVAAWPAHRPVCRLEK